MGEDLRNIDDGVLAVTLFLQALLLLKIQLVVDGLQLGLDEVQFEVLFRIHHLHLPVVIFLDCVDFILNYLQRLALLLVDFLLAQQYFLDLGLDEKDFLVLDLLTLRLLMHSVRFIEMLLLGELVVLNHNHFLWELMKGLEIHAFLSPFMRVVVLLGVLVRDLREVFGLRGDLDLRLVTFCVALVVVPGLQALRLLLLIQLRGWGWRVHLLGAVILIARFDEIGGSCVLRGDFVKGFVLILRVSLRLRLRGFLLPDILYVSVFRPMVISLVRSFVACFLGPLGFLIIISVGISVAIHYRRYNFA